MAKKNQQIKQEQSVFQLNIPEMEHKPLIVCGAGKDWQEQLEAVTGDYDLMLVNAAGISYPRNFKYWASWTPNYFKAVEDLRKEYGFNCLYTKVSQFPQEDCMEVPVLISGGGSGLYAVLSGIKLGYTKIIVLGINLLSVENKHYQKGWEKSFADLKEVVRGVSGFPKKLFGEPSPEWLTNFSSSTGKTESK